MQFKVLAVKQVPKSLFTNVVIAVGDAKQAMQMMTVLVEDLRLEPGDELTLSVKKGRA
jgi:hypothetical protein